ncbi:MAG: hypothetical protein DFNUSKGM_003194 [Candidatus Fervidibacter sacchari]
MRESLRTIGILSLAVVLAVGAFVGIGSGKLSQTADVWKKVAEQLGIEERDLGIDAVDSHEQYGAGLGGHFDEVFLVVWNLNTGEIIYTTRKKNRYPTALTWVGRKLVYIAYDGISFSYELDADYITSKPVRAKVFLFDPQTNHETVLNIPAGEVDVIHACGDDTILLSYPLPPDYISTRIVWYSVSKETKIQEWVVNVGQPFGIWAEDAYIFYCAPDHKRIWVVTYIDGPKLPFTGYAPAPVPVLAIVDEQGTKVLMDAEKEWLEQWLGRSCHLVRLLKRGEEEIIAAITAKWTGRWEDLEFYLVHFSSGKEIWRRRLDVRRVKAKGFRDFNFIWISQDGKKVLCREYRGEKRLFWWDVTNHQIEVITQNKEFRLYWHNSSKIWLEEISDKSLLKVE